MMAERKSGWWYPYIFVGGFAVVLVVNFTMAYFASSTFSGLSTEKPYEKGLAYNKTLDAAKVQEQMGWAVDVEVEPGANHGLHVTIRYRDRDGKPVEGLTVRGRMVRPTAKGHDREVVLASVGAGVYATHQEMPLPGIWDMTVDAGAPGISYQISRRILAP
jgi:nitrogen fixation protein FixH